jgi:putative ATP-dependent endonuclease of OLD family
MSDLTHVRSMKKTPAGVFASRLQYSVSESEKKILAREVLARRGEILFSRALILCEGMTEEQVIPAMFEIFSDGRTLFDLGISCISVGGQNYAPFVKLACSFGIPTFIVSDNDGVTQTTLTSQISNLRTEINHPLGADVFGVSYCGNTNDFEAELLNTLKMRDEINEAFVLYETDATTNQQYRTAKSAEIAALTDADILKRMRDAKTSYSGFLADVIRQNPNNKQKNGLITQAVQDAITAIKGWIPT